MARGMAERDGREATLEKFAVHHSFSRNRPLADGFFGHKHWWLDAEQGTAAQMFTPSTMRT